MDVAIIFLVVVAQAMTFIFFETAEAKDEIDPVPRPACIFAHVPF